MSASWAEILRTERRASGAAGSRRLHANVRPVARGHGYFLVAGSMPFAWTTVIASGPARNWSTAFAAAASRYSPAPRIERNRS